MKIEEKIKHFTTVTIESVQSKCDLEFKEYKAELDEKFERHKKEALRLAALEEKNLRENIERKASKEYTMEQLHIRRKINHKQDELREKIFADVEARLKSFKETDGYKVYLIKQIKKAVNFAGDEEIHIYIDESDGDMKAELERECKIELFISDHSIKGGIRAELPDRNILIDNTFETRFEEEKEKFLVVI